MINANGGYSVRFLTQAETDEIKDTIALINYPKPVRSIRAHHLYWWAEEGHATYMSLKEYLQWVDYLRGHKLKMMLSLPNNHFDKLPISSGASGAGSQIDPDTNPYDETTSVARATEVLEYFLQFKISFRIFQVNEPFTGEYGDNGAGGAEILDAQSDWNAKYTLDAYRSALDAKGFANRKLYACQAYLLTNYNAADYPRDLHLALDITALPNTTDWYDDGKSYYKYLAARAQNPKYIMCSECGAWATYGFADRSAEWWSTQMLANELWIHEFCSRISGEFCKHDLYSTNVMTDGSSNSLFSKLAADIDEPLQVHPMLDVGDERCQFIR